LACLPVEQSWQSSIFFWLVFFPLFGAIPITYILYISFIVWKHKLLPPQGKRRLLVIYFGRIVVVFILCWVPYMLLLFVFTTWMPTWVHFAGGTLSHLQGAISAALSLLKPDLYHAVKSFYTCQVCRREKDSEPTESITNSNSSWLLNFNAVSRRTASVFRSSKSKKRTSSSFFRLTSSRNSSSIDTGQRVCSEDADDDGVPDAKVDLESDAENGVATSTPSPNCGSTRPDNAGDDELDEPAFVSECWPDRNGEYSTASTTLSNNDDLSVCSNNNE